MNVSIIIPFYNAENYFKRCIKSLFQQTLQNIEIIFVDDCSTDNSVKIINSLIKEYEFPTEKVKIIRHEKNSGISTARNTGLNAAQGEYIGWVDSDDWIERDTFQKMYDFAILNDSDIIWTNFANNYGSYEDIIDQHIVVDKQGIIEALISGKLIGVMWNKLVKRNLYINNNIQFPDNLNMCEDLRVSVQLFYYAERIAYLPQVFYHYVKSNSTSISTINTQVPQVNLHWIKNVEGIIKFLDDKKIKNLRKPIGLMKLSTKKNLLIKGNNIEIFKQWNAIFPEANNFVWETHLPLYYKLLAYTIDKKYWMLTKTLINIKLFIKKK